MDRLTLYSIATGTVLLAGFVAALEKLYRRLVAWLRREFAPLVAGVQTAVANLQETVDAQQKAIDRIEHELTTNGGGSLRDEVLAIRRDLDARHQQNSARLDKVDARLEDVELKLERAQQDQRKLVRALTTHLRLGHRQAHTEEPARGIPDEVVEGLEALNDIDDDHRRRRKGRP